MGLIYLVIGRAEIIKMPGVKQSANIAKNDYLAARRNKMKQKKSKLHKPSMIDNKKARQLKKLEKLKRKIATKAELKKAVKDKKNGHNRLSVLVQGQRRTLQLALINAPPF